MNAVNKRKESYRKFLKNPNKENLLNYRRISHETQKTIRKRKKVNFKSFVTEIGNMSISHFWENIKKLKNCAFNNRKQFPSSSSGGSNASYQ